MQQKEYIKRQPSLLREMCLYAPRTLAMLSDNIAVVNNVVQYQSLEQFGVKKFNPAEMTEWETVRLFSLSLSQSLSLSGFLPSLVSL